MDVSQTTRVRRVMLHFADVAPTGARARRGARARNAQAERTKTAARVFSRGRANRGRRDATRGDGAAARRGRFRESPKPGVGSPYTKKKKKKTCSSRRARFDRARAEGAPASVDRRPRAPVARRAPRRAPGRALGDNAGGNRPTRRPGVGSRSPDPPPPATSAEGKTKQPTRATIAKKKKISSLLPSPRSRARFVARRTRNGFPTREEDARALERPAAARARRRVARRLLRSARRSSRRSGAGASARRRGRRVASRANQQNKPSTAAGARTFSGRDRFGLGASLRRGGLVLRRRGANGGFGGQRGATVGVGWRKRASAASAPVVERW